MSTLLRPWARARDRSIGKGGNKGDAIICGAQHPGHSNDNITTHCSAAELSELLRAVKLIESGSSAPLLRRVA